MNELRPRMVKNKSQKLTYEGDGKKLCFKELTKICKYSYYIHTTRKNIRAIKK